MLVPFRHHADFLNDKNSDIYEWQHQDIYNLINKNEPIINFNKNEASEGYKILNRLNIQEKDKIILLCVRDAAWRHRFKKNNRKRVTIRDNDIRILGINKLFV